MVEGRVFGEHVHSHFGAVSMTHGLSGCTTVIDWKRFAVPAFPEYSVQRKGSVLNESFTHLVMRGQERGVWLPILINDNREV